MMNRLCIVLVLSLCLTCTGTLFAKPRTEVKTPELTVRLIERTPEQIAAFYEARGFSKQMVQVLKAQCFLGVLIKNTSPHVIWLDLAGWTFTDQTGAVPRLDRTYWRDKWQALQIPMAHQSTFRWTLLPEKLDFRPDEREGGNILLPRRGHPLRIEAVFMLDDGTQQKPVKIRFDDIRCPR
ncbi:MAG: hypothetical protein OEY07_02990 [Gammaproteobacteria bacterium]|nr:hypothetical protein [Gammaproteobacteria bacterium]